MLMFVTRTLKQIQETFDKSVDRRTGAVDSLTFVNPKYEPKRSPPAQGKRARAPPVTDLPEVRAALKRTDDPTIDLNTRDVMRHAPPSQNALTATEMMEALLQSARGALSYIAWSYTDLYAQMRAWDGTWAGLFQHWALVWRAMVTAAITYGLYQTGPVLETVWFGLLWLLEEAWLAVRWIGEELYVLWHDMVGLLIPNDPSVQGALDHKQRLGY